jgi:hypothetical protein
LGAIDVVMDDDELIAVAAHSPLGETERSAGRWLPYLRLLAATGTCGLAIAVLQLGAVGLLLFTVRGPRSRLEDAS